MKTLWCWRCGRDVPMLDEEEYQRIHEVLMACRERVPELNKIPAAERPHPFDDVGREYERITGEAGWHVNAILHHRLSEFGPPCRACGKPLRSPRAKLCAACGARVDPSG